MNPTTATPTSEDLLSSLTERLSALTHSLNAWMHEQPHTLAELEHQVVRLLKELGAALLAGLCSLADTPSLPGTLACPCGHTATYQRQRSAQVTTLLGPIRFSRAYYLCSTCGHGFHPLDLQLQCCAGSRSAALDELLALLGATQDSFVQAAQVLERLTLVHISANSVRDATEQLGSLLVAHQALPLEQQPPCSQPATHAESSTPRLYITMDGVMAHLQQRGWSEIKVGCCYHTHTKRERKHPERLEIRAENTSYLTTLEQAHEFGWQLWQEALRRGLSRAEDVVVLGDGAHWIWNIAQSHFPGATEIVDWYHASEYVWSAASAIWGETGSERAAWAQVQLDLLWEGKVAEVLVELERRRSSGEAVEAAVSYYREHQQRMDYASYRARGLQIGSGSVESACKQVVSARLKQAGMIWGETGAAAVAAVRAWLKSERWAEAVEMRKVRRRSYRRKQECEARERCAVTEQAEKEEQKPLTAAAVSKRSRLSEEALEQVRAELAEQRGKNVWRKARSSQKRSEFATQQAEHRPKVAA